MPKNISDPLSREADLLAFETALQTLPNRIYWDTWVLARSTGCRIGDILTIKFMDVDSQGRWTFSPQKQKRESKSGRPLPQKTVRKRFNKRAREIIQQRQKLAVAGQVWVFPTPKPRGDVIKPITRQAIWQQWKVAAKRAGIRGVNVGTHTARKTTGVRAWKATGGDAAQVAHLLYQSDLQSLMHYLGLTDAASDALSEAIG